MPAEDTGLCNDLLQKRQPLPLPRQVIAASFPSAPGKLAEFVDVRGQFEFGMAVALTLATNELEWTDMLTQVFGPHEQALKFRALRNQVLTSNIANADTPNYKARDFEFSAALKNAQSGQLSLQKTSEHHQSAWRTNRLGAEIQYRVPTQPTLDGNTVETDIEQAAYAENVIQYRATLTFLNGTIKTMLYALRGGD